MMSDHPHLLNLEMRGCWERNGYFNRPRNRSSRSKRNRRHGWSPYLNLLIHILPITITYYLINLEFLTGCRRRYWLMLNMMFSTDQIMWNCWYLICYVLLWSERCKIIILHLSALIAYIQMDLILIQFIQKKCKWDRPTWLFHFNGIGYLSDFFIVIYHCCFVLLVFRCVSFKFVTRDVLNIIPLWFEKVDFHTNKTAATMQTWFYSLQFGWLPKSIKQYVNLRIQCTLNGTMVGNQFSTHLPWRTMIALKTTNYWSEWNRAEKS